MDLKSLKYFVSAVTEGSISAASSKCFVAQPSITMAINKLEDEFNCVLLERHRKGVTPTVQGQRFYDMAIELLQHADALASNFRVQRQALTLKVAIHPSVQIRYLNTLIATAKTLSLTVEFSISEAENDADILICPKQTSVKQQVFHAIGKERYTLLLPKSNPLAHRTSLRIEDLDKQALIERTHCENRALFEQMIKHYNLLLPICARVDNEEWSLALAATGIGITLTPLPLHFKDPRFVSHDLAELLGVELPDRIIGIAYQRTTCSEKQSVLDQISQYLISRPDTQMNLN